MHDFVPLQVKRLTKLFHPALSLPSNGISSGAELVRVPIVQPPSSSTLPNQETHRRQVYREEYGIKPRRGSIPDDGDDHHIMHNNAHSSHPLFLTEKEYRSYGLRSERHLLPTTASVGLPTDHAYDNHRFDHAREQIPSNPISLSNNAALVQREPDCHNIHFLSEKEYRTYGLRGYPGAPSRQAPTLETSRSYEDSVKNLCNPYDDSTTSLVNRYLSLPGSVATPTEPYHLTSRGGYVNGSSYMRGGKDHLGILDPKGEISHSSYASHALSDYNINHLRLGSEPNITSSTVSSRYSFEGPSFLRR